MRDRDAAIVMHPALSGGGSIAKRLLKNGCSIEALRPFEAEDGFDYVDVKGSDAPKRIVTNDATLLDREWLLLDKGVPEIAKPRLRIYGDFIAAGLVLNLPNGLGHSVLQYQNMSDITDAGVAMDPVSKTDRDRVVFDLNHLPLPVIFKDWSFTLRELEMSRRGEKPLDMTHYRLSIRKVAEAMEKLLLGTWGAVSYAGYPVYGLTTYPDRLIGSLTDPDGIGWTPEDFIDDLIEMRAALYNVNHRGPFRVYVGPGWDSYLDKDYSAAKGDNTLRARAEAIRGIGAIVTSDFMSDFDVIMVEMQEDTVRIVTGMPITPIMWEQTGGLEICGKVMAISVPNFRSDFDGQCGLAHYTVA